MTAATPTCTPVCAPSRGRERGFTLVEMLVVAIILGVLSAVAVPLYLNQQDKAARAHTKTNHRNTLATVMIARENTRQTLRQITGDTCSFCRCTGQTVYRVKDPAFAGTPCETYWTRMTARLADAAGEPVSSVRALMTDGWGYPIMFDENESDPSHGGQCGLSEDLLVSPGRNHLFGHVDHHNDDISTAIPLGGCLT